MVTDKQLKKITEKIVKAQAKTSRETSLDLSGLSIDSETLELVMPEILKIQNLTKLDISKNKLTGLPDSIGELSSLIQLIVKKNSIKDVPYTLANLGNLENLDFSSNPTLSPESDALVDHINQTMLDVTNRYKKALSILYPNNKERAKITKQIEASDLDSAPVNDNTFNDNTIQNTVIKSSKNAIKLFLSKVPFHNEAEMNLYGPTIKMLLSQLRDQNILIEDRNIILLGMTSSLGDCETPVKEHLMRVKIAELLKPGSTLSEENYLMIERLALIEETSKLKNILPNEKIEVVNALVSLVYSQKHIGFLTQQSNIDLEFIKGENENLSKERDLPPISGSGYGFTLLKSDVIKEFVALVSEGNDGIPHILNEKKLKELTDNYLTGKGLQNDSVAIEREKYIQKYPEDMQMFIMEDSDLSDTLFSADMDEVGDMMNFPAHQEELRGLLKNENKEESIKQKYTDYVSEQQSKIEAFVNQKKASQNTQTEGQGLSTENAMSDHNRYRQMASVQIQSQTETQRRESRTLSTSARHDRTETQREESRPFQGSAGHRR